jgi:ankyrin repeat protein
VSARVALGSGYGWTALNNAAANGRLEVARLLLESGANRAATDTCGDTARDFALRNDHTAVAALLR